MSACPTCGVENPNRTKFCPECGTALAAGDTASSSGETRKLVTVLFADVAGSTALGETIDPETMRALMDRYFGLMRRVIEAHGGTVEKFIGDAVMAVFGAPVVHEDDALRGVRAAIEIRAGLDAIADVTTHGQRIRFRTGINSGEVLAGDPASGQAFVTGDAVNVAARLEQAARPGEIVLGEATLQLVRDAVTVEAIEPVSAKGKSEPIRAYRLVTVDRERAGHARRLDAPLVGRDRELARLGQVFRATVEERSCQLFTLLGTAGIGKSRLVAEFAATAETQAIVLRGRCLSYGEGITYWPIGEIIRAAAEIDDGDSADSARAKVRARLEGERDADTLATRVASTIGLSLETAPQEEIFWAIRKTFEHIARDRPLVVVIEDIHWAEPTMLDLIEHIADWSRDASILLLCPARPELLDTRADWGGGKLNVTTVLLEPLGVEATTRLITELPGGVALPTEVKDRILAAAEGNPLYVEEMLRMLADDGLLIEGTAGIWSASDALAEVRVPASINALVSARLERLAPDERAVAQRASVVGRVFEQAAVTELANDALRPEVGRTLLALVRKELVRPDRSELTAGDAFKFRHILIRDAAYEALPKAERAVLHERFADWLERTIGERLAEYGEIVGYHLEQAHRYRVELGEDDDHVATLGSRAAIYLAAAGERAFDRGDLAAAERLLSRASGLGPIGSPERLQLQPDIGFALFSIGRITEATDLLQRAVVEATAANLPHLAIRADLERMLVRILSAGEHLEARATADAAIAPLAELGDELGLARAHLVIASAAWMNGRVEEAVTARRLAMEHAERAGDARTAGRATFWGAEYYGPAPAIAAIAEVEGQLATASGNPLRRAQALFSLSGLYAMRGQADRSRAAYHEVRSILEELGARLWVAGTAEIGGVAELNLDDPVRAERYLDDGIRELERLGATGYLTSQLSIKSIAVARQGRSEEALGLAERAIREGSPEDALVLITAQTGMAIALVDLGRTPEAVEVARAAVIGCEATDWISYHGNALLALAQAERATGDVRAAVRSATLAREMSAAKQDAMGERRATAFLAS